MLRLVGLREGAWVPDNTAEAPTSPGRLRPDTLYVTEGSLHLLEAAITPGLSARGSNPLRCSKACEAVSLCNPHLVPPVSLLPASLSDVQVPDRPAFKSQQL